jgi:UDP-N-acetylmuramate--alanine ligase
VLEILKTKSFDVLLTVGAGDIDTLVQPIKQYLINQNN